MTISLQKKLEETFGDIRLRKAEGYMVSWTLLSNIYHALTYCNKSQSLKTRWLKKISSLDLDKNTEEEAAKEANEKFERIKRIISIGDYWNDDEWVLVLLLRLELEMEKDFFNYKKIDFPRLELAKLCEKMKELSQTKKNKEVFEFSARQMKNNSPLPFADIWFQAEHQNKNN
jgi:hypothetical protein